MPRTVADGLTRIGVRRGESILVALSGGRDSVALFHALRALQERFGYRIAAAHFNHAIRGAESDRDEAFVRELCARCDVELVVERASGLAFDTPNLEERAREARHAFLNATAVRVGAGYVAVAHHADDQAETVLMRFLRGAGASGLAAMAERGPGRIIRPMLAVTREEVSAYLESSGERFVDDSSNQSLAVLRNRIRVELIPMLERNYAPGLRERLFRLAAEMRELDSFVSAAARREIEANACKDGLDISGFAALHPALQAEVIRQYLMHSKGSLRRIERAHIEAARRLCLEGPVNGWLDLPGLRLFREYGLLRTAAAAPGVPPPFMVKLEEGRTEVPEAGFAFDAVMVGKAAGSPCDQFEALFDGASVTDQLMVRNFRPGDRIAPVGMKGHRKVKDVFIDNKLPRQKRGIFPVVEFEGEIAWLPGLVRGRAGLVTESSSRVLRIRAFAVR